MTVITLGFSSLFLPQLLEGSKLSDTFRWLKHVHEAMCGLMHPPGFQHKDDKTVLV